MPQPSTKSARQRRREAGQVRTPGTRVLRYAHHMVGDSIEEQQQIVSELQAAVTADVRRRGLALEDVDLLLVDGDDIDPMLARCVEGSAVAARDGMARSGVRRLAVLVVKAKPLSSGDITFGPDLATQVSRSFSTAVGRAKKKAASERIGPAGADLDDDNVTLD